MTVPAANESDGVGAQSGWMQVNQSITDLSVGFRRLSAMAMNLSKEINGGGNGAAVLAAKGYSTTANPNNPDSQSDAAYALEAIGWLNNYGQVFFGQAAVPTSYDFSNALAPFQAGQIGLVTRVGRARGQPRLAVDGVGELGLRWRRRVTGLPAPRQPAGDQPGHPVTADPERLARRDRRHRTGLGVAVQRPERDHQHRITWGQRESHGLTIRCIV